MYQPLRVSLVSPYEQNGASREALQRPLQARWKRMITRRIAELDHANKDWKTGNFPLHDFVQIYVDAVLPFDATLDGIRAFAAQRILRIR
jgi:hypothetical protein